MKKPRFTKSKAVRLAARGVVGLFVGYVSVYLMLSLSGRYRPLVFSSGGNVREYQVWAPAGFYNPIPSPQVGGWQRNLISLSFYPLWCIDTKIIHGTKGPNERSSGDGGEPVLFAIERQGPAAPDYER